MPDAHEATWKQMQQKAPKELIGADGHLPLLVAVGVILPSEGHSVVLEGHQPMVGDGNPVRVARKIMQHVFRPAEGRLGVDNPVLAEQLAQELRKRSAARPGLSAGRGTAAFSAEQTF